MWYAFEDKMPEVGRPILVIELTQGDERPVAESDPADVREYAGEAGSVPIYFASAFIGMAKQIGFGVAVFRANGRDPAAEQLSDFDHADLMSAGKWCYLSEMIEASDVVDRVVGDVTVEHEAPIRGNIKGQ